MPRAESRQGLLQVKLKEPLYTRLHALAEARGQTAAEITRGLIIQELERTGRKAQTSASGRRRGRPPGSKNRPLGPERLTLSVELPEEEL